MGLTTRKSVPLVLEGVTPRFPIRVMGLPSVPFESMGLTPKKSAPLESMGLSSKKSDPLRLVGVTPSKCLIRVNGSYSQERQRD